MSGLSRLDNVAPVVHAVKTRDRPPIQLLDLDEPLDAREVFDYLRDIMDPEHPYTLEQLNVVQEELIEVSSLSFLLFCLFRFWTSPALPEIFVGFFFIVVR